MQGQSVIKKTKSLTKVVMISVSLI